ncbi:hypothetical protein [Sporosarcina thermotolerans]|nr:hypothetical protein [Sporosarcina thermotolerans]WHT49645.1 hypothetical protein QNH10_09165 [Sporosarcina thermotolerans]
MAFGDTANKLVLKSQLFFLLNERRLTALTLAIESLEDRLTRDGS